MHRLDSFNVENLPYWLVKFNDGICCFLKVWDWLDFEIIIDLTDLLHFCHWTLLFYRVFPSIDWDLGMSYYYDYDQISCFFVNKILNCIFILISLSFAKKHKTVKRYINCELVCISLAPLVYFVLVSFHFIFRNLYSLLLLLAYLIECVFLQIDLFGRSNENINGWNCGLNFVCCRTFGQ